MSSASKNSMNPDVYFDNSLYGYIYKIENLVNGKVYIGQTTQKPEKRENQHFNGLDRNAHGNLYLQNAYNKYGRSNFIFNVLNWAINQKNLNELEIYYIDQYDSLNHKKGYNLRQGGDNGKLSLETRKKISISLIGRIHSEETKNKISKANKNPSDETRKKKSKAKSGKNHHFFGKNLTLEHRKKLSEAFSGKNNPMYGTNGIKSPNYGIPWLTKSKIKSGMSQRGRSLFGFTGASLQKNSKPEIKLWQSGIKCKGKRKVLGSFIDPLSAQIVHDLVFDAIHAKEELL